jgi:hypothetical protein
MHRALHGKFGYVDRKRGDASGVNRIGHFGYGVALRL